MQVLKNTLNRIQAIIQYLVTTSDLRDDWEAVVIGGRVAENVHDGSHLLYPVQTGDRRTHHLSACWGETEDRSETNRGGKGMRQ